MSFIRREFEYVQPVHTVAEKCDCRRCLAVICDSLTFLRQCGQCLMRHIDCCVDCSHTDNQYNLRYHVFSRPTVTRLCIAVATVGETDVKHTFIRSITITTTTTQHCTTFVRQVWQWGQNRVWKLCLESYLHSLNTAVTLLPHGLQRSTLAYFVYKAYLFTTGNWRTLNTR